MYKEAVILAFLILWFIFYHSFGSKKMKFFVSYVFVKRRSISNAICDFVLYLQNEA